MRPFPLILLSVGLALSSCGEADTTTRLDVRISYGFVPVGEIDRVEFRGNGRMQEISGQPSQLTIRLADATRVDLEVRALARDGSLVGSREQTVSPVLGQSVQVDIVLASALCGSCNPNETCVIDRCLSTDAGPGDAGPGDDAMEMRDVPLVDGSTTDAPTAIDAGDVGGDAGPIDAGPIDAGFDSAVDATPLYNCRTNRGTVLFQSFETPSGEPISSNTVIDEGMAPCGPNSIRSQTDGYFYFSDDPSFDDPGSLDFYAYFPSGPAAGGEIVLSRGSSDGSAGDLLVFLDVGVTVVVRGLVPAVRCSGLITRNEWHHIGINFGLNLQLWVDGILVNAKPALSTVEGVLTESFDCGSGTISTLMGNNPLVFGADQRRSEPGSHTPISDSFVGLRVDHVRWSNATINYADR